MGSKSDHCRKGGKRMKRKDREDRNTAWPASGFLGTEGRKKMTNWL